jgi:meiotic recombination protein SPO11
MNSHHTFCDSDATPFPLPPVSSSTFSVAQQTRQEVIDRIEFMVASVLQQLDQGKVPSLTSLPPFCRDVVDEYICEDGNGIDADGGADDIDCFEDTHCDKVSSKDNACLVKTFSGAQGRNFTNILLVMSFCHQLLLSQRATTTREVYYHYVTHFRSQKECDAAILDAGILLGLPRHALGLQASPKGWCVGDLQLISHETIDGSSADTHEGHVVWDGRYATAALPITSEWLNEHPNVHVQTEQARCIIVVEKEGVFHRLVQDGLCKRYPCVIVTGKGFPDLATRALVHTLHQQLSLPVRGICDCNPFGVLVLQTYQCSGRKGADGGDSYGVPIDWLGLRPLQVEQLKSQIRQDTSDSLPPQVFQQLTALDRRRLEALIKGSASNDDTNTRSDWVNSADCPDLAKRRLQELQAMDSLGYKVELEALNWLGMDFCTSWVELVLHHQDRLDRTKAVESIDGSAFPWLDIL